MKKVSIISPVYENVNRISETITTLIEFFQDKYEFEVFYYHSKDLPENLIKDARFIFNKIDNKQSFDECVTDGMQKSNGDCVIIADLNNVDYKDYILKLLVEWENKAQIVLLKQDKKKLSFWKRIGHFFAGIGRKIGQIFLSVANLNKDFGAERNFQLFARNVVELINQFPEKNYYLRNFDCWVDYRVSIVWINTKIKVNRKQKKWTNSLLQFIIATCLFAGGLTAMILTAGLIPEANKNMFRLVGTGILTLFGVLAILGLFKHVVYRLTNLKPNQTK